MLMPSELRATALFRSARGTRSVTSHELATSRMKLPMLPSTVAAHRTANTGWRSGAKLPRADSAIRALPQVMPGDQQETANQAEVLEEGVGGHEALGWRHLPEAQRDEGGEQGEAGQRQRAQPTIEAR